MVGSGIQTRRPKMYGTLKLGVCADPETESVFLMVQPINPAHYLPTERVLWIIAGGFCC